MIFFSEGSRCGKVKRDGHGEMGNETRSCRWWEKEEMWWSQTAIVAGRWGGKAHDDSIYAGQMSIHYIPAGKKDNRVLAPRQTFLVPGLPVSTTLGSKWRGEQR